MAGGGRVFLSAVTGEFSTARDAVANDLQARDLELRVQRSFRQEPGGDTLLRLLHDYIGECDAVVCVIGARSGACPPPAAAAEFANLLPPGITEASYTQWEFFFARAHKRRLSLYIAATDYRPDQDQPISDDFPALQKALRRPHQGCGSALCSVLEPPPIARRSAEGAVARQAANQADRAALCQPRQPVQGARGLSTP